MPSALLQVLITCSLKYCPWTQALPLLGWPCPYSPHFPTCQPNLQPLCSPSLLGQPQPHGYPFLPLSDGRATKPTSPWPLPFTLQLECHGLQFHSKVELCLLSEHPGRGNLVLGASVGSRIWSTCFLGDLWPLARPPHQHWLPSDRHSTCHLGLLTTCKLALLLFLLVTPWSLLPGAVTVCVKASWEPRAHLLVSFSVWCTSTPTSTFQ